MCEFVKCGRSELRDRSFHVLWILLHDLFLKITLKIMARKASRVSNNSSNLEKEYQRMVYSAPCSMISFQSYLVGMDWNKM